ncbi:MAG: M23 family metallopeptidase [Acidocella sp.]|nr:M23 family metallopeptidase [Acidocella sp.]
MSSVVLKLRTRVTDFIDHWFHDRIFLVRGRDKVRGLTVTKREQLAVAIIASGFVIWSAGATLTAALSGDGLMRAAHAQTALGHAVQHAKAELALVQAHSQAMIAKLQAEATEAQAQRNDAVAAANAEVAADHAQVEDLTRQVETSIGSVQSIIKSTGLDPAHLQAAAPAPVPDNQTASTPAQPVAPIDADPSRAQLLDDVGQLQSLNAVLQHLPISAPVSNVDISSPFGYRASPFTGAREFHVGIDLRDPMNTPVYATAPGVVIFAGVEDGYGNLIEIDHGYGLTTRYSHLNKILVTVGTKVGLHQEIGLLGNTGWSTGPHLLYETRYDGVPLNPLQFIKVYH